MGASFTVCNINPGVARSEFWLSIIALIEHERALQHTSDPLIPRTRFDQFYTKLDAGPYLDMERNHCAQWFFDNTQSDFLLFVDSDISFHPQQAFDLISCADESSITLLSGVYFNQFSHYAGELRPLIYKWETLTDQPSHLSHKLNPFSLAELQSLVPPDKPHEIDAFGAGFLAIHRSVLVDMQKYYTPPTPYFAELVIDGYHNGEDLTFACRAKAIGHQPYVLPSVQVDHIKTCILRPLPNVIAQ